MKLKQLGLNLCKCNTTKDSIISLIESIVTMKDTLKSLNLNLNKNNVKEIKFGNYIGQLTNLKKLTLLFPNFFVGPQGSVELGNSLINLTKLEQFNLFLPRNYIGTESSGIKAITNSLSQLKTLQQLKLYL
eukprot:TRINITY_DN13882_c0_g2_i1.p2 TRINITY_DN13882_c0_g2~~TRINITY_DN13882_c0_g2_i1.p2  ORF type:complete len:131 (-),score=18.72 TRINITY_DN13882_c0_g2_i1:325-717(-)